MRLLWTRCRRSRRLLLSLLAVCGTVGGAWLSWTHAAADPGTIRIGGTGAAYGGMRELARAFQQKYPGATVTFVPSLGSPGGIKAVLAVAIDLALSSRAPTQTESQQGAAAVEYGKSPFIFVTTYQGEGADFTLPQLASIFAADLKTWPDGTPIRLILRPEGDINTLILRGLSAAMAQAVDKAQSREGMLVAITDDESMAMIGKIRGALGCATLTQIMTEKLPLRILPVNGVRPSLQTLAEGAYPYHRDFFLVTGPQSSPATGRFLEFVLSPEGRELLAQTGVMVGNGKK